MWKKWFIKLKCFAVILITWGKLANWITVSRHYLIYYTLWFTGPRPRIFFRQVHILAKRFFLADLMTAGFQARISHVTLWCVTVLEEFQLIFLMIGKDNLKYSGNSLIVNFFRFDRNGFWMGYKPEWGTRISFPVKFKEKNG